MMFALSVYAHPYCTRNSCRNDTLRHARARAYDEIYSHKAMVAVAFNQSNFISTRDISESK